MNISPLSSYFYSLSSISSRTAWTRIASSRLKTTKLTGFLVFLTLLFFGVFATAAEVVSVNINSESELRAAITQINSGYYSDAERVEFSINTDISLNSDLDELKVPADSSTQFVFTGTNNTVMRGNGNQGFVISATDQSTVSFANLTFSGFIARGEDGEDGTKSGGGGGAGLGGAIYVKSGKTSLLDVKFQSNKAIGGDGGTYDSEAAKQYGTGGESSDGTGIGGEGRNTTVSVPSATFGGGGGGSANEDNAETGGLGAGSGGTLTVDNQNYGVGGGGLGAGGAVFVESGATLSVQYSDSFESKDAFSGNTVLGGSASGDAESGNAIGNALFAAGNVSFDTATPDGGTKKVVFSKSQTIGGFAEIVDFENILQQDLAEIKNNSGDLSVVGGGTLYMQGENLSLGKVSVDGSTLIVENGKAISDYSEVELSNGAVLELSSNETIGYLTGDARSEVHLFHTNDDGTGKTGGKTLTIGGDEYSSAYSDVDPGNGLTVLGDRITAFSGKIVTDHNKSTQETLVKTGNGLLILAGDNTNSYTVLEKEIVKDGDGNDVEIDVLKTYQDDFTIQLQGGTIQVNHDKALGGGIVNVKHSDTEIQRNMLQAGVSELNLANTFNIQTSNPFRIGVAEELASDTNVELTLSGQITGNQSIMMNMGNKDQVLKLTNISAVYADSNQLNQVQLNQGTLAVVGDYVLTKAGNGTQSDPDVYEWKNSLGSAKIVALAGSENNAQLRIDTQGMNLSNQIVVDSNRLTITNGYDEILDERVSKLTLSGTIGGSGGLKIDLTETSDVAILSGHLNGKALNYAGDTEISHGILQFAYDEVNQKASTIQMAGGLILANNGTLDLNGNAVSFAGKGVYDLNGTITDSSAAQTGTLVKAGEGTWNLNLQQSLGQLNVDAGTVVLKNANSVASASLAKSTTLELGTDVRLESIKGETGSTLKVGEHQLTLAGNGVAFLGSLSGGENAVIVVENGTTQKEGVPNWDLYGSSSSTWTGTIKVEEGANLRVSGLGALGKSVKESDSDAVGTVVLDRSTLSINTYNGPATLGKLEIIDLNGEGFGIVDTLSEYDVLYAYDITGSGNLVKNGSGALNLIGTNTGFSGDIHFNEGFVLLQNNAQIGSGKIISDGDAEDTRTLIIFADDEASSRTFNNEVVINEKMALHYIDLPDLILGGSVSGAGAWEIQSAGKIVLDGDYDQYTGEIKAGAGTFLQLGSIAGQGNINLLNSSVCVEAGAMFDASGTIGRLSVKSDGILQMTGDTQLKITNELKLDSNSILAIDCVGTAAGEAERYSSIVIDGGTAIINGGTLFVNATDVQIGDTFTLFATENGGMIQVNQYLALTDNADGVRAVGTFDEATNTYTYTFVGFDYREGANTTIQKTMGNYLNEIADSTTTSLELNEALGEIENFLIENPEQGFDELAGQVYASMGGAQIHAMTMLNQNLAGNLRPTAQAGQPWDGTGYTLGQAYCESGLSGWMSAYGMFGDADSDGNASGYDLDVYGGIIALERCSYNMSRRLGFYYGYGQTKIKLDSSLGKGTSDDNRLGLYLKWDDPLGYGILSGGVGFSSYKFNRRVLNASFGAKMDGVQSSFYAERGISCRSTFGMFQPYIGLQYVYQDQDSFDEGIAPGLKGETVSTNSLRSMFGARLVKDFGTAYGAGASQIYVQGHWMHEYLDDKSDFTASLAPPASFTISGNGHGRDWAVLGVGADWFATNHAQIFGAYDAQFNGDSLFHIGSVGLKVVW